MNKSIIILFALICSLSGFQIFKNKQTTNLKAIAWPFTLCGTGHWTIQKLFLASTPKRDTNNDIDVLGTATDDTSFSTVDVNVKLNGVFLHSQIVEFKKSYQNEDTIQFKYQNFIPSFAPPGTYALTFTFKDENKENGCLGFSFKL